MIITQCKFEDIWASDCSYVDIGLTKYVYFYYSFLKNKQIEVTRLQRGSAQPHVYAIDVMDILMITPTQSLIEDYQNIIIPIFENIGKIELKNQNLRKTRDLLLPKLMSGQLSTENLNLK